LNKVQYWEELGSLYELVKEGLARLVLVPEWSLESMMHYWYDTVWNVVPRDERQTDIQTDLRVLH
jgi:hypothetical protein